MRAIYTSLLVILTQLIVSSCVKEKPMNLRLINNSQYDIVSLDFSGVVNGVNQEIQSGDSTEIIQTTYESRFRLTPKLMCLEINEFSGENEPKELSLRPCEAFEKEDFEDQTSRIIISDHTTADSIVFDIKIN